MKMAKATEADIQAALDIANAFEALTERWFPSVPEAIALEENEHFDSCDAEQCKRVLNHLLDIADRGSLFRVAGGMSVLLAPANKIVDPESDTLEHHPERKAMHGELERLREAKPEAEWHEGIGPVLWWRFPVDEPPYCGTPLDSSWPGYHTHWTPLLAPALPAANIKPEEKQQ